MFKNMSTKTKTILAIVVVVILIVVIVLVARSRKKKKEAEAAALNPAPESKPLAKPSGGNQPTTGTKPNAPQTEKRPVTQNPNPNNNRPSNNPQVNGAGNNTMNIVKPEGNVNGNNQPENQGGEKKSPLSELPDNNPQS